MSVPLSAAEGLFTAVQPLNSTARDRIVRVWLVACPDADAAEWRRLVEADKKRRQRAAKAGPSPVPPEPGNAAGQNAPVPLEPGNAAGQHIPVPLEPGKAAGPARGGQKTGPSPLDPPSPEKTPGKEKKSLRDKEKKAAPLPVTDEQFVAELKADPTYHGLNIDLEAGKMHRWCATNCQRPSRRRLVNWLNKAVGDRAMQPPPLHGTGPPPGDAPVHVHAAAAPPSRPIRSSSEYYLDACP